MFWQHLRSLNHEKMIRNPTLFLIKYTRGRMDEFRHATWKERGKGFGMFWLHVTNIACAVHLCTEYVVRASKMEGPSMFPTFNGGGEYVLEDRLTPRLFPDRIERGELIIFKSPIMPERLVCKRVLGLPGDIVCVDPTGEEAPSTEHIVVPKGHLWVGGDNAALSRDSRIYGPVSMSLIQSKLLIKMSRSPTIPNSVTYID